MEAPVCITIIFVLSLAVCSRGAPTVHTKLGEIEGIVENEVHQFRNIPYAKPPVGNLRFSKPQAHGPWNGVLDGTQFGPSCMQECPPEFKRMLPHQRQSEDCLSLNVYVPGHPATISKKSVMVWIHGGAYLFGQAMYFDASQLAFNGDVVIVTLNYRLGVFGFLTSLDGRVPGNNGLWDQQLALEWIHEHIGSFGGNPRSVTLFGESAGSFSVTLQALNPMNEGLFHRVIAQSAVPTSALTLCPASKSISSDVGISLNCTDDTFGWVFMSCLRQISADRLLSAQQEIIMIPDPSMKVELRIGPVVDGLMIPDVPSNLLTDLSSPSYKFFRTLDFITGLTNQDGSIASNSLNAIAKFAKFDINVGFPSNLFFGMLFPPLVSAFYGASVNFTLSKGYVCPIYESSDLTEQAVKVIDAFTDTIFVVPSIRILNFHSDGNTESNTYQYLFERPHLDPLEHERLPPWIKGSSHTSELFFLFGTQDLFRKYNITVHPTDLVLSQQMMKYWSNFAKNGDPNSPDLPPWKPYDSDERTYISLDTEVTSRTRLYADRVTMWEETLPNVLQTSSRYT